MGEQAIYTGRAHIFTIDPKTKKSWIPASSQAVDVKFFFDYTKQAYRIVSIDDNESNKRVVINSTITPRMTFKKTSQKFGQWTDAGTKTVYGLGFNSELELDQFVDQFTRSVEASRKNKPDDIDHQRQESQAKSISPSDAYSIDTVTIPPNYSSSWQPHPPATQRISSASTTASSPSKQSSASGNQPDALSTAQASITRLEAELANQNKEYESKLRAANIECQRLQTLLDDRQDENKIARLEADNARLRKKVSELEEQMQRVTADHHGLPPLHEKMGMHLREIIDLHRRMGSLSVINNGSVK